MGGMKEHVYKPPTHAEAMAAAERYTFLPAARRSGRDRRWTRAWDETRMHCLEQGSRKVLIKWSRNRGSVHACTLLGSHTHVHLMRDVSIWSASTRENTSGTHGTAAVASGSADTSSQQYDCSSCSVTLGGSTFHSGEEDTLIYLHLNMSGKPLTPPLYRFCSETELLLSKGGTEIALALQLR